MDPVLVTVMVLLSLIPPLLFTLFIRARETYDREPIRAVIGAFIWGATLGVAVALLLHWVFEFGYSQVGSGIRLSASFVAAVIAAPIVEELSKGFGLGAARKHMQELEDGIVYGAAVGLGFAATENLVYGFAALMEGGATLALSTIVLRSLSSTLLHAGASALLGYGYSLYVNRRGTFGIVFVFYLGAVVLHAAFNFLVSYNIAFGLVWAVLLVAFVMTWARKKIESLDAISGR